MLSPPDDHSTVQPPGPARRAARCLALLAALLLLCAPPAPAAAALEMPWREAGWSEREAAAHLLDRFTYGARPGDIERAIEMGLEPWFEEQLAAAVDDAGLAARLAPLDIWQMSALEIQELFPDPGRVLRMAIESGETEALDGERPDRRELRRLFEEQGYRPPRELIAQLVVHKVLRGVYSENQLTEVMTDFWFNHFNVSLSDAQARSWVLSYERDAIRPRVLGEFEDLLVATAMHPAMLQYLDNAASRATRDRQTLLTMTSGQRGGSRGRAATQRAQRERERRPGRSSGLNENYARELMELHTLGVDGGYTQEDVVEVARAFTGWTVLPPPDLDRVHRRLARAQRSGVELVIDEGFLFNPEAHDAEVKWVLGEKLPRGRGIEDGLDVLSMLAGHSSTALFLSTKLAVRFVRDDPSPDLVERLARRYTESGGNTADVLRSLVSSREFWSAEARREKIKSPFELVVSSLRALDADVREPRALVGWLERLGQPLYAYEAPTGYPDRNSAWVSSGALLARMNFALQLATDRIPGVAVDLDALAGGREPESAAAALELYAPLLLPERDLSETLQQLAPLVGDLRIPERVAEAAPPPSETAPSAGIDPVDDVMSSFPSTARAGELSPMAQVVGLLVGSPEFQRR